MRDRLTVRARDEEGVVLVIVALLLVVFLACMALAIDLGSFYTTQRHAQSAADAAALAAAQDLASGNTAIGPDITTFIHENYPDAGSITFTTPYKGNSTKVRVEVAGKSPAFFGKALGVSSANVDASAVAGGGANEGSSVVFAKDTNCGGAGVTINGNTLTAGNVHSNGSVYNNANNTTIGALSYGGPLGCSLTQNGNSPITNKTIDSKDEPWPYDYSNQSFPAVPSCTPGPNVLIAPTFSWTGGTIPGPVPGSGPLIYCATTGDITLGGTGVTAQPGTIFVAEQGNIIINGTQATAAGTYLANGPNGTIQINANNSTLNGIFESTGTNGQINVNGNSITGNATFVANAFQLNGNAIQLAPYPGENGLLAYETGTQSLNVNGNGYLDGGTIFAPNAAIVYNGDGSGQVSGFMEAQDVTINGNHLTITGTGPNTSYGGTPTLLQ